MHMKDGDKDGGNNPKLFIQYMLMGNMYVFGTANEEIRLLYFHLWSRKLGNNLNRKLRKIKW